MAAKSSVLGNSVRRISSSNVTAQASTAITAALLLGLQQNDSQGLHYHSQ